MAKIDLNTVVKIEQAISKKYGPETIVNPKSGWSKEKELDYLEQIKLQHKRQLMKSQDMVIFKNFFTRHFSSKNFCKYIVLIVVLWITSNSSITSTDFLITSGC